MHPILWALLFVFGGAIYLWCFALKRKYKDIERIPGPPTKFLVGNALEFGKNVVGKFEVERVLICDGARVFLKVFFLADIFYNIQRIIKTYGPIVRIWLGPFRLQLFITDPDYVEYFLSSNVQIKKSDGYEFARQLIGSGLFLSTGDTWRKHRKILTQAFHFQILEEFFDHFNSCGRILVEKLREKAGQKLDVHPYVHLCALDVLCESTLKIKADAQENSDHLLISAAEEFLAIFLKRIFSPLNRFHFIFRFTSDHRRQQRCIKVLHGFTEKVIRNRKEERLADGHVTPGLKKKKAFLDVLLESDEFTDEEIRDEIHSFLAAGHDTVATAVSFGLFELAKHPQIQEKILAEINEIVGDLDFTMTHLQEMKYLDGVMKEVLRLYPPFACFGRELVEDVTLDGIRIPKGTMVVFHPYAHHRNAKLFTNPENFHPDRFLVEDVEKRHPFAFIPFSAGPRNCIGSKYALMNCKTMLANVIRNFELSPVIPAHTPLLSNMGIMKSVNGLPIVLKIRV